MNKFVDLFGSIADYFLHSISVADPISGNHCVFNVLLEIIYCKIGYGSYTALCKKSVGLFQSGFTDKRNFTFVRYFQCKTHTGNSGADDEEIEFSYHSFVISHRKATK